MKITKKDNYILVEAIPTNFNEFFTVFKTQFNKIKKNNIIINFNSDFSFKTEEILLFLEYSQIQINNNFSFILVLPCIIDIENYPETLNISPTIEEAEDILEMDLIERDLGF